VNLVCISQPQLRSVTKELSKMRITEQKTLKKIERLQHETDMSVNVSFYTQVFLYIDMKIDPSFSWLKLKINRGILQFKMHLSAMLLKLIP